MKMLDDLRETSKKIYELEDRRDKIVSEFFEAYPIADMSESISTVHYLDEEYIITDFDFEELIVLLQTEPYSKGNKVETVSLEDFVGLYKSSHCEHKI